MNQFIHTYLFSNADIYYYTTTELDDRLEQNMTHLYSALDELAVEKD